MYWYSKTVVILVVLAVSAMSPSRSDTSHKAARTTFKRRRYLDTGYFIRRGNGKLIIMQPGSPSPSDSFNGWTGLLEAAASSGGFSVELIPWNSPDSPFHNPNATSADLRRLAILSSNIRAEYRKRRDEAADGNDQAGLDSPDSGPNIMPPPFGMMNSIYGDYLIRYNVGSKPTYGIFDTGSDLIWLQCSSLRNQATRYLEPHSEPTYRNITCGDPECSRRHISIAKCFHDDQTCRYRVLHADEGNLASDIFTFAYQRDGSDDVEERRLNFGCGDDTSNGDIIHGGGFVDGRSMDLGVVGSSRNGLSLVGQMGFHQLSYCVPSLSHSRPTGVLKLGPGAIIAGPESQTSLYSTESGYYYVKVVGIKVSGSLLRLNESVFQPNEKGTRGVIIDTGTPFTELVSEAYDALVVQIKRMVMLMYGEEPVQDDNDELCCEDCFRTPLITIMFEGLEFPIPMRNMWDVINSTKYCLAVRRAQGNLSVIGMFQQRNINVGFDLKKNIVSLNRMDCSSVR